jgi:hypothetical protein
MKYTAIIFQTEDGHYVGVCREVEGVVVTRPTPEEVLEVLPMRVRQLKEARGNDWIDKLHSVETFEV